MMKNRKKLIWDNYNSLFKEVAWFMLVIKILIVLFKLYIMITHSHSYIV